MLIHSKFMDFQASCVQSFDILLRAYKPLFSYEMIFSKCLSHGSMLSVSTFLMRVIKRLWFYKITVLPKQVGVAKTCTNSFTTLLPTDHKFILVMCVDSHI